MYQTGGGGVRDMTVGCAAQGGTEGGCVTQKGCGVDMTYIFEDSS